MTAPRTLLIVTCHFPPSAASGSFRMLGFARHLPRHGWRASVVAPPSLPWEPVDPGLAARVPPETTVYPAAYPSNRPARKLAPFWCWLPGAMRACRQALADVRPDAVLTSGPPHQAHWIGWWLKRRFGVPWIADFRDPWTPGVRLERGHDLGSLSARTQERLVLKWADAAIANTPGACRVLRAAYPRLRSKFVTITNGYDPEAFADFAPPPPVNGRRLRLVHTGAIYLGRDPSPVLDAVRSLADTGRADLEVAFLGPPPESDLDLEAEAQRRSIGDRVEVVGQVPYARCLAEMAAADILLLMDSPGRTSGVPAKLYEYLGAGRPVLALGAATEDLAWVLRESGLPHRTVPPGNAEATAEALDDLAAQVGASDPRRDPPRRFTRAATAGQLAALLDRLVGAGGGGGKSREPRAKGRESRVESQVP